MNRTPTIAPTVTREDGPMEGIVKSHPAYGMLGFSRVQGDPGTLFGSEVKHTTSFIQMRVTQATEKWHLSQSWRHGNGKALIEVNMSHAQFAEAITSLNMGSGVPCTVRWLPGQELPHIADESTVHEQIKADVKDTTKEAVDAIATLRAAILGAKMTKTQQAELLGLADQAKARLDNSLPFVLDQYAEALDTMKARAATEVDAMLTGAIHRAGLDALKLDQSRETPELRA